VLLSAVLVEEAEEPAFHATSCPISDPLLAVPSLFHVHPPSFLCAVLPQFQTPWLFPPLLFLIR
jgi:hypothetical protein